MSRFVNAKAVTDAVASDPYMILFVTNQMLITEEAYITAVKKDWELGEHGELWMRQKYGAERIEHARLQEQGEKEARENVRADCEAIALEIDRGYGPPGTDAPTRDQKVWALCVLERQQEREAYGDIMTEEDFDGLYLKQIS